MIKENEKSNENTINSIFSKLGIKYIPFVGIIDKDFALRWLSRGRELFFVSRKLRGDREVVLEAIRYNAQDGFINTTRELRADKEITLIAVRRMGSLLQMASRELRGDKEVVLEAVRSDGSALWYASRELRADKEVVLKAVKQNGTALQYASRELRADKEVVLAAVLECGEALRYASKELRGDRELVVEAVKSDSEAIMFASRELRRDRKAILAEAKQSLIKKLNESKVVIMKAKEPDEKTAENASQLKRSKDEVKQKLLKEIGRKRKNIKEKEQEVESLNQKLTVQNKAPIDPRD